MRNEENHTTHNRPYSQLMGEVFERGDAKRVALALHVPEQHVHEMVADVRRNPFEAASLTIKTLRASGNVTGADELALAFARDLGFVAYREAGRTEAHDFSTLCREFADVVAARADAGTEIDAAEAQRIERQAFELIEAARGYIDDVRASVKSNVRRMA